VNAHLHTRQEGVALAISLILLVALTILGVATLSSTRLNEKITSNAQQKAVAFEAAESAINTVWVDPVLVMESVVAGGVGQYTDPPPVFPDGFEPELSKSFDQTNDKGTSIDISSSVSIQYCGESSLPVGTELSADQSQIRMVALLFDVNGVATISGSNASADHVQRGFTPVPETFRSGDCQVPEL